MERKIKMTDVTTQIADIRSQYPGNIMASTFDIAKYGTLSEGEKSHVLQIVRTGIDNPNSSVGAYAMSPDDYIAYAWLLDPIVQKYHNVSPDFVHSSDWDLSGKNYDLREIDAGLEDISMRVRVARNDSEYPLPGAMTRDERVTFEDKMVGIFQELIDDPAWGGRYVSLTPGSEHEIDEEEYLQLVGEHKMFKDMSGDPYLRSAGISNDWPYGRGMYVSGDGKSIVWVNEEDHLRLISMETGTDLSDVFNNLKSLVDEIEGRGVDYAVSSKYGAVASCPSNIGTAMRASVHIKLPNMVEDEETMKRIAKTHGLSVRGTGGEHTGYGEDGMVDISPSGRLGKSEAEVVGALFDGISAMLEDENSQN